MGIKAHTVGQSELEKFKPVLLSHFCTPSQLLRKVAVIVRLPVSRKTDADSQFRHQKGLSDGVRQSKKHLIEKHTEGLKRRFKLKTALYNNSSGGCFGEGELCEVPVRQ